MGTSAFAPTLATTGIDNATSNLIGPNTLQALLQAVRASQPNAGSQPRAPGPSEGTCAGGEIVSADRASFQNAVDDLVSMGLVSDRQMARGLLTQHGDISTVVAILTKT